MYHWWIYPPEVPLPIWADGFLSIVLSPLNSFRNSLFIKYVIPIHCKNAIGTVNNLVYWLILFWPTSHCSVNSSKEGITVLKSWSIIDDVIYGETQIAIIAKFSNAHHINITRYQNHPAAHASNVDHIKDDKLTNGTGMKINNL